MPFLPNMPRLPLPISLFISLFITRLNSSISLRIKVIDLTEVEIELIDLTMDDDHPQPLPIVTQPTPAVHFIPHFLF